jgi:hypothetical protein
MSCVSWPEVPFADITTDLPEPRLPATNADYSILKRRASVMARHATICRACRKNSLASKPHTAYL